MAVARAAIRPTRSLTCQPLIALGTRRPSRTFSTVIDENISPVSSSLSPPPSPAPHAAGALLQDTVNANEPRTNWTKNEIRELFNTPLMELAFNSVALTL